MNWEKVKVGTVVKPKGLSNHIGYIYRVDGETNEVKVNWSFDLSTWENYKNIEEIEITSMGFIKGLYETNVSAKTYL